MLISVLINLRKSPIFLLLLLGVFFSSCENILEKDNPKDLHIVSISTFGDKAKNTKICRDFTSL